MRKLLMILALLFISIGIASCTGNQSITISFETNGGNEIEDMVINMNSTSVELPTPIREGYTFVGWYLDENLSSPFTIASLLTQTAVLKLYAKWDGEEDQFTITFESNGGSAVTAITQAENTAVTAPTNPTKAGFTFGGWYSDVGLSTAYTFSTMPSQNITLYAKWNPVVTNQTITFDSNGGSAVSSITQSVGSTVTAPTNPTKDGYTFGGWYSDSGLTTAYTFTTMPSTATTLYAKWTANNYTITFEEDGGSTVPDITQGFGTAVIAPANPTKAGYTFGGWYSNSGLTTAYTFTTMPLNGITLYAKWNAVNYTITFEEDGGSTVPNITQGYATAVTAPANPTKEGYTFGGWYSNSSLTTAYTFTTMPLNGITLYAKWNGQQYTLTFMNIDGLLPMDLDAGTALTLPTPTKEGYILEGWYEDSYFITKFTDNVMPAYDVSLYAKWIPQVYAITFFVEEGVTITGNEASYGQIIPVEKETPIKEGFIFVGWYLDEELNESAIGQMMPANAITLYAKWIAETTIWTIEDIITYQPEHMKLRATIVYMFAGPNIGYYVADETGIILVTSPITFTLGTIVEFEADFNMHEYVPELINVINQVEITEGTPTTITHVETPISTIIHSDYSDPFVMGQPVIIQGVVTPVPMTTNYALTEAGTGEVIMINFKSYTPMSDPFLAHMGEIVVIRAFVYGFDPFMEEWQVLYDPSTPLEIITLSDQEKVDELLEFASMMLNGAEFYSNQILELPTSDPVYDATLLFVTIGDNASYFNPTTGEFLPTDVERQITINLTVTINDKSGQVDVVITLKPIAVLSIAEFIALDDGDYGLVEGIVIFSVQDMALMIIADETGAMLPIQTDQLAEVGDLVNVDGYKVNMMGLVIMMGTSETRVTVIESGLPNSITPFELTVSQFISLDVNQSLYWGRYFEVSGTLGFDEITHSFTLTVDTDEMYVTVLSKDVYDLLIPFVGYELTLRGFSIPNFDEEPAFLMYIFTGQVEDIILDYTDQELLDLIGAGLKGYLEDETYLPGDLLDLPAEHEFLPITATYTVDPLDALLVSTEWIISDAITEATVITVHATLYLGEATTDIVISIHVEPLDILTIAEFLNLNDEELHFIQAVVIYVNRNEMMMIVADETGIIIAPLDMPEINQGDFVMLYGMKMDTSGMILITNNPKEIVVEVLGYDHEMPFVPLMYTLEELIDSKLNEPISYLEYVEVYATLRKNEMAEMYYLENEFDQQLYIATMMADDTTALDAHVDLEIRLSGFLMYVDDEDMHVLMFINTGYDIKEGLSDEELVLYVQDKIETVFLDRIFRPGATIELPLTYLSDFVEISYEVYGENVGLYNLTTGVISDMITEYTEINLRATITSGSATAIAEFIFVVEPIVTQTIAEFLAAEENELIVVRGIVILSHFGDGPIIITDGSDMLFIVKDLDVNVGDEIIVEGTVAIEKGIKLMWDYESTVLIEVVSKGLENPLKPEVMTITAFNALDIDDTDNWGRFIQVIGYPTYSEESYYPLLRPELDSSEFVPIVPVYIFDEYVFPDLNLLYMYSGFRVVVKGFLFPNFDDDHDPYAPDRMILIPTSDFMYVDYYTDLDKMNALIALGEAQLSSKVFHPGNDLELPDEIPAIGATIVWSFVGDVSSIFDSVNHVFLDVTEPTTVELKAVVTIGLLTQEHIFELTVAPYTLISIQDVYDLEDGEFAKVQGVVVKKIDANQAILQQTGSDIYLFIESFNGYGGLDAIDIGNVILVFGTKYSYNGYTYLDGGDDQAYMEDKGAATLDSLIVNVAKLSDVAEFDERDINYTKYYELEGHLIKEEGYGYYYLTDGTHTILLETMNSDISDELELYVGYDVLVRLFLYQKLYMSMDEMWSGFVVDEAVFIDDVTFTNEEILSFMSMYASQLSFLDYKDGLSYYLPVTHPIYGGSYTYEVLIADHDKATVTGNKIDFVSSVDDYTVVVNITCSYDASNTIDPYTLSVYYYEPEVPDFIPGAKMLIPELIGETPEGEFVGLYIYTVERENNWGGGDVMVVDFYFPEAYLLGANYMMIQVYNPITLAWEFIEDIDGPITTNWMNFSLNFNSGATVRVITDTNLVSNEVTFNYTDIDTRFSGYYLDMSMSNTNVMFPYVGYGLLLDDVTITDLFGNSITGGYTINWYRVNPYTFELIQIEGEHDHTYQTTIADVGYLLMVEVMGDGVNVGGFMHILVEESPRIFNSGFVQNVTNMGFDIGFEYNVNLSMLEDLLEIRNNQYELIPFVTITETTTPYVYHVNVNLSSYQEIYIEVKNNVFITGSQEDYHMWEVIHTYIYEW